MPISCSARRSTSVFDADAELLCCADGTHVRGRGRDPTTFAETGAPGARDRTFNSRFLLVDARLLDGEAHAGLLALVSPETWAKTDTPHTDQFVLNRYFAGRQTLIGSTYNYRLAHTDAIAGREGLPWTAAGVLHFNLGAALQSAHQAVDSGVAAACPARNAASGHPARIQALARRVAGMPDRRAPAVRAS